MALVYIHFEPCPKCSEGDYPFLDIAGKGKYGYKYRAKCKTCYYEQQDAYESVEECAKAWNKASNEAWSYILENEYKRLMRRFNDFK